MHVFGFFLTTSNYRLSIFTDTTKWASPSFFFEKIPSEIKNLKIEVVHFFVHIELRSPKSESSISY